MGCVMYTIAYSTTKVLRINGLQIMCGLILDVMMSFHKIIGILEDLARADKPAPTVGRMIL